jgi:hypothetical protein
MPSEKKMTPAEFKRKMLEIADTVEVDQEQAHCEGDDLMIEVLRQHGYGEGCRVFNKMEKWYA